MDQAGQPKLIDFGVARLAAPEFASAKQDTQVGQNHGHITDTMSPEQIQADPDEMDTRSDVYSLGVICYELLSGKTPYELKGLPLPRVVKVITEAEPARSSSNNREFRRRPRNIVLKAMEKDKTQRYQSAADLAADIDRYLTDEPIQARPASVVYQMRKFARRNRAMVGGIIATLVALSLGLIGTSWWAVVARQARNEAQQSEYRTIEKTAQIAMQRGALGKTRASIHRSGPRDRRVERTRSVGAPGATSGTVRSE